MLKVAQYRYRITARGYHMTVQLDGNVPQKQSCNHEHHLSG